MHTFTPTSGPYSTNSDGAGLYAGLILSDNTLYGTAYWGGSSGNGTVFAVNTDGTGFMNLHNFTAGVGSFPNVTNTDGANPQSGLILLGDTLYGTAKFGGSSGNGTVFAVNTDGTGFTNLHSFTATSALGYTNSDGANPVAGLILSANTLYGTAPGGGILGKGTMFAINTDGTGFTNLHSFSDSDGVNPAAGLILSGNTLYGTASHGGSSGNGTVFAVNTNGTGFTMLYNFAAAGGYPPINSDGASPQAELILSGCMLYGTASGGGGSGSGTVFSLSFAPQLTITPSDSNVVLMWPTNNAGFDYSGFVLQSTTNLVPSAVWTSVSPEPVVVNGQYTITNPISGTQRFYRLSQ